MSFPGFLSPPRLCNLKKWTTFAGYGFNLHAEKGKAGQYIGKVDPESPADHGGLKTKDYLVEVNSINVEDLSHQKVVEIVKETPNSVKMLVVDYETYKYCKENGISIRSSMPEVVSFTTPDTQPPAGGVIEEPQETRHEALERHQVESESAEPSVQEVDQHDEDAIAEEQEVVTTEPEQQQQQREPSPVHHRDQSEADSSNTNGAASPAAAPPAAPPSKDPVGNLSLDEMRAKIGNNRRTQVKMNPSSFSEKYSMFQAL